MARDVQRKIVSIVTKWNPVCIMNGLKSRCHYWHVVCRDATRIQNNGGRPSPLTRTKLVPLVTRNVIGIVFSTYAVVVGLHDYHATIDIARLFSQSSKGRSKDLKGTSVMIIDEQSFDPGIAYRLSEHPRSALRLLDNDEKYVSCWVNYKLFFSF